MERPAEVMGMRLRVLAATEQIRAGDIADEQRAAREQQGRFLTARAVGDQETNMLRRVPRRVQHLEDHPPISKRSPSASLRTG
jgi:hypothetical protein